MRTRGEFARGISLVCFSMRRTYPGFNRGDTRRSEIIDDGSCKRNEMFLMNEKSAARDHIECARARARARCVLYAR